MMPSADAAETETVVIPNFILKVWKILEEGQHTDCIRWDESGLSFHIVDPFKFSSEVLPLYYKHNNMSSFVRQLNMYGFHKVANLDRGSIRTSESQELEFQHESFIRGYPQLLQNVKRKLGPTQGALAASGLSVPQLLEQVDDMRRQQESVDAQLNELKQENQALWQELDVSRQMHQKQQAIVEKLIQFLLTSVGPNAAIAGGPNNGQKRPMIAMPPGFLALDGAGPSQAKRIKGVSDRPSPPTVGSGPILQEIVEEPQPIYIPTTSAQAFRLASMAAAPPTVSAPSVVTSTDVKQSVLYRSGGRLMARPTAPQPKPIVVDAKGVGPLQVIPMSTMSQTVPVVSLSTVPSGQNITYVIVPASVAEAAATSGVMSTAPPVPVAGVRPPLQYHLQQNVPQPSSLGQYLIPPHPVSTASPTPIISSPEESPLHSTLEDDSAQTDVLTEYLVPVPDRKGLPAQSQQMPRQQVPPAPAKQGRSLPSENFDHSGFTPRGISPENQSLTRSISQEDLHEFVSNVDDELDVLKEFLQTQTPHDENMKTALAELFDKDDEADKEVSGIINGQEVQVYKSPLNMVTGDIASSDNQTNGSRSFNGEKTMPYFNAVTEPYADPIPLPDNFMAPNDPLETPPVTSARPVFR